MGNFTVTVTARDSTELNADYIFNVEIKRNNQVPREGSNFFNGHAFGYALRCFKNHNTFFEDEIALLFMLDFVFNVTT